METVDPRSLITNLTPPVVVAAGAESAAPTVEVEGLDAFYGQRQVLFDVEMRARQGEIVVIMGGSGSGKSTLMRHLVGLDPPVRGTVRLLGQDINTLPMEEMLALRRKIGVAFQGGAMFSSLSVAENIKLPMREHTNLNETTMDIVARMKLEIVNLSGFGDLMPSELSGGMLKRAAVARAIIMDPKLLFFDEPSAGLDPAVSSALDDLILQLRAAMEMTIVVVTHEVQSAFKIADRIVILDEGRVLADDTVDGLRNNPDRRIQDLLNRRAKREHLDAVEYLRRLTGEA